MENPTDAHERIGQAPLGTGAVRIDRPGRRTRRRPRPPASKWTMACKSGSRQRSRSAPGKRAATTPRTLGGGPASSLLVREERGDLVEEAVGALRAVIDAVPGIARARVQDGGRMRQVGELRARGVHLVVSDAHAALPKAIRAVFAGGSSQRCTVHFTRNVQAKVLESDQAMATAEVRTIFLQPNCANAARAHPRKELESIYTTSGDLPS